MFARLPRACVFAALLGHLGLASMCLQSLIWRANRLPDTCAMFRMHARYVTPCVQPRYGA